MAAGRLFLAFDRNRSCLALNYCDALYPLAPASYSSILKEPHPALDRIAAIAGAVDSSDAERLHSEIAAAIGTPSVASELNDHLRRLSVDRQHLCRLHEMQPWRLKDWRTARDHLSYRRFFEITGLVGMRIEDRAVFADTHRLVLDLVKEGLVDGLRIDHIDGLADAEAYLRRLRHETGNRTYIVVEKIMQPNEALPANWPVDGTTGYEFISALAELLTEEAPRPVFGTRRSDALRKKRSPNANCWCSAITSTRKWGGSPNLPLASGGTRIATALPRPFAI